MTRKYKIEPASHIDYEKIIAVFHPYMIIIRDFYVNLHNFCDPETEN